MVAGTAGGIQLAAAGAGTRPLADRVKQAVFGSIEPLLRGAAVVDLCAGSGAAGIEALSRGAASAVLVERDARACAVIADNLRRTGLAAQATVVRRDAIAALRDLGASGSRFGIAIVDPPYAETTQYVQRILGQSPAVAGSGTGSALYRYIERDGTVTITNVPRGGSAVSFR